jgi:hypothetical protein
MRRDNVGDTVEQLANVTRHIRVPGMGVKNVSALQIRCHRQIDAERSDSRIRPFQFAEVLVAMHSHPARQFRTIRAGSLSIERVDMYISVTCQHFCQFSYVNASATIDVRRVFPGE